MEGTQVESSPTTPCPHCRGTGSESVAVQWSDGVGMSQATCGLCLGATEFACAPQHLAGHLAMLLREERQLRAGANEALTRLRTDVLCFLVTEKHLAPAGVSVDGTPIVPGFPGASPHSSTWLDHLRAAVKPFAAARQAEVVAMQERDHAAGHHSRPVPPHSCPATNARQFCKACQEG